ncbi:MAG: thioredoxin domain-containing protein [Eudoraea sp.]
MNHKYTNALINESSPYLLQHAHNPVNWEPWSNEILEKAKKENKLLLVSIGYAACHWCHVMEEECFENTEVAQIMNQHFINIKIDREERPDIDQIYMDALQMMTARGGWPLNIVALPNGEPFWGTTYMKKEDWMQVLLELFQLYQKNPDKVIAYAQNLAEGIRNISLIEPKTNIEILPLSKLGELVQNWSNYFDPEYGGYKRAPKFMMPTNLDFLLHYAVSTKDDTLLEYVQHSLTKMAYGGIYDQLAGGFSRYSVDERWHVPHFEKMLYDNAQLISLYAKAFAQSQNPLYKTVVEETIHFIRTELMAPTSAFYSSLDADSLNEENELEEGAYYVWTEKELKLLLGDHFAIFKAYYNINDFGLWENYNYVLIRTKSTEELALEYGISVSELKKTITLCKKILLTARNLRRRPRLDDKILCSWNGLMLKALTDAYRYLGKNQYLSMALENAAFIDENLIKKDGSLFHNHKNGKSSINGFLEDYASLIDAFIGLFETSHNELWLEKSKSLMDYCLLHFYDHKSHLFYFTSDVDSVLIRRSIELTDNVIPSTNSMMAKNLFKLSRYYTNEAYEEISKKMTLSITPSLSKDISNYANWAHSFLNFQKPFFEISITGENYLEITQKLQRRYLPNVLFAATNNESALGLLKGRVVKGKTLIYLCEFGTCQLPTEEVEEVLQNFK